MNLMFHLYRLRMLDRYQLQPRFAHDISSYEFEFECSSSSPSFVAILAWCLFYLPSGKTVTHMLFIIGREVLFIYYCSCGIIYLLFACLFIVYVQLIAFGLLSTGYESHGFEANIELSQETSGDDDRVIDANYAKVLLLSSQKKIKQKQNASLFKL